jgi:hypothetical protein
MMQVKTARIFKKSGYFRAIQEATERVGQPLSTGERVTFPAETI